MDGGLGIRHIGCLNQSLLAKIGWKIISNPECLLSRVVGCKYQITKEAIMSTVFAMSRPLSWGGRGLKWGLELLKDNLAWQVGFPSSLDIWRDRWIHGKSLAHLLQLAESDLCTKPRLMVALLQNASGEWDQAKVLNTCGSDVMPLVHSTSIPLVDESDSLFWNLTTNGQYSSKSGYKLAFSKLWDAKASEKDKSRMDPLSVDFCKKLLWRLPIHNKWKLFLWKIFSNSLPCGDEARNRNLQWNYLCVSCSAQSSFVESLAHLFRDCSFASRIWAASPLGIRAHIGNNVSIQQWIINWLKLFQNSTSVVSAISNFVSTLWHIWCCRNKLIFQGISVDYYGLFGLISIDANNNIKVENDKRKATTDIDPVSFEDVEDTFLLRNHFPLCVIGSNVCSNHIQIKCDASWKSNLKDTAGWLFQDNTGTIFHTGRATFWAKSAFHAESIALKLACVDAFDRGYRHIDATTDCLNLVLQDAAPVLCFIISLVSSCHCFSLSHCPRRVNRIAHAIAKTIA